MNRKDFVKTIVALGCLNYQDSFSQAFDQPQNRSYHVSMAPDILLANLAYVKAFEDAGIDKVWLTGFMYGYWYSKAAVLRKARRLLNDAGIATGIINIPLGHPGDSLGSSSGEVPLTPPHHWEMKTDINGRQVSGTHIFPGAVNENLDALRQLRDDDFSDFFLDDDFRLAVGPGQVGGNFDDEAKRTFLNSHRYNERDWQTMLSNIRQGKLDYKLKAFIDYQCDLLSDAFKKISKVSRNRTGNMVMYLGSEKAGIRLKDYSGFPFRVGEGAFNDESFRSVKSKTNELFSVLFHRQFTTPELAYSETTAFPHDQLSVENLCAKLCISTLADVRNTMFMSGLTPFPLSYWRTLTPAMQEQRRIHATVAGVTARGILKGFFGEHSRYVGKDNPYSLFFAIGIPFEISATATIEEDMVFMGDEDAQAFTEGLVPGLKSVQVMHRLKGAGFKGMCVEEKLEALFCWKNERLHLWKDVPYVQEDEPVVCRWYPAIRLVLLWNLAEAKRTVTLNWREKKYTVAIEKLKLAEVRL
ncbi:MAG: hypothetical protein KF746_16655 [Chitinophagaceae bacterium]|nr:hypothetical protein [Chitinophagaceae bacterium]MBX3257940.1 hypothetical protein [Chitinophagaceae bacterium]